MLESVVSWSLRPAENDDCAEDSGRIPPPTSRNHPSLKHLGPAADRPVKPTSEAEAAAEQKKLDELMSGGAEGHQDHEDPTMLGLRCWLMSLGLSSRVDKPETWRFVFSNGYLAAEIMSHYFPQAVSMHSYDKASSAKAKRQNWELPAYSF